MLNNAKHRIYSFLILLSTIAVLTGCGNGNDKIEEPINLSRTISANGIPDFSGALRDMEFQAGIMSPDQDTILLAQQNNPDADHTSFADSTATLWKFYLER